MRLLNTSRHPFAADYLGNGGDLFIFQKIFGHSTLEITPCYAELTDIDVEYKQKAFSSAEKLSV